MTRETKHQILIEEGTIRSPRLTLRPWSADDATAALAIYGSEEVTRWLSPAMGRVDDAAAMEKVIAGWLADPLPTPAGRWAMELVETGDSSAARCSSPCRPRSTTCRSGGSWLRPSGGRVSGRGGRPRGGALRVRVGCRGALRGRPTEERARCTHCALHRHGVGGRVREVLRSPPAGLPAPQWRARRPQAPEDLPPGRTGHGRDVTTTGLLLAAGAGRRMGRPKALVEDWLVRSVGVLRDGGCPQVVVGASGLPRTRRGPCSRARTSRRRSSDWAEGMGASLRAGLAALAGVEDAALVTLVDLPDVGPDVVRRLLDRPVTGATLARATYDGTPGHPVLLGREHWTGVTESARGDQGARDRPRHTRRGACRVWRSGHGPRCRPWRDGQRTVNVLVTRQPANQGVLTNTILMLCVPRRIPLNRITLRPPFR